MSPKKMGARGGRARASRLTAERRSEIAKQGANARWERDRSRKSPSKAKKATEAAATSEGPQKAVIRAMEADIGKIMRAFTASWRTIHPHESISDYATATALHVLSLVSPTIIKTIAG